MNKKNLFYIFHTIFLIFYLFLIGATIEPLKSYSTAIMDIKPLILGTVAMYIILGCILGLDNLITEFHKVGKWKINYNKIIFSFLPILLIILLIFFWGLGLVPIPKSFLKEKSILSFLSILFGYQLITCIVKESDF